MLPPKHSDVDGNIIEKWVAFNLLIRQKGYKYNKVGHTRVHVSSDNGTHQQDGKFSMIPYGCRVRMEHVVPCNIHTVKAWRWAKLNYASDFSSSEALSRPSIPLKDSHYDMANQIIISY